MHFIKIEGSSSVVIIGGGAVGVELAGEILDRYPDKKITVLNSGEKLLNNVKLGEKLQDKAREALEAQGVVVKTGAATVNIQRLVSLVL